MANSPNRAAAEPRAMPQNVNNSQELVAVNGVIVPYLKKNQSPCFQNGGGQEEAFSKGKQSFKPFHQTIRFHDWGEGTNERRLVRLHI